MTDESSLNVQNAFFNQARKDRTRVTIHLMNGQRLSGLIKAFDRFAVILGSRQGDQIIFKHAISTVSAARPPQEKAEQPADEKQGRGFGNYIEFEGKKE